MNKLWLQYLSYAGLLVISLAMQAFQPDLHAILCTPLPVGGYPGSDDNMGPPLNTPQTLPTERIK